MRDMGIAALRALLTPATVVVNGREYTRSKGGRWSFQPRNHHLRTEVHRTSRLHHALNALAKEQSYSLAVRESLEKAGRVMEAAREFESQVTNSGWTRGLGYDCTITISVVNGLTGHTALQRLLDAARGAAE